MPVSRACETSDPCRLLIGLSSVSSETSITSLARVILLIMDMYQPMWSMSSAPYVGGSLSTSDSPKICPSFFVRSGSNAFATP